jgi:hypothetical protein
MTVGGRARAVEPRTGHTKSTIASLNFDGSSRKGWCPDSSNQTRAFEGAAKAWKYATLVSVGTQRSLRPRKKKTGMSNAGTACRRFSRETSTHMAFRENRKPRAILGRSRIDDSGPPKRARPATHSARRLILPSKR